ncbi:Detected protein of confused Function [Hibiscus syriacus]|uniref:Detected protein of confused Function n=1 Tax=Hibiscus syriacus TaxID=106335 RepID=A0A6A3C8Y8_HIBSY|nr:Detected protein of confused Function [Hibiscus syriacus]
MEMVVDEAADGWRPRADYVRELEENSVVLGLDDIRDDELVCMLSEGDLDGDGALNQVEFFVFSCLG